MTRTEIEAQAAQLHDMGGRYRLWDDGQIQEMAAVGLASTLACWLPGGTKSPLNLPGKSIKSRFVQLADLSMANRLRGAFEAVLQGEAKPSKKQAAVLMACGHPESAVASSDEGTAYCTMCDAESAIGD